MQRATKSERSLKIMPEEETFPKFVGLVGLVIALPFIFRIITFIFTWIAPFFLIGGFVVLAFKAYEAGAEGIFRFVLRSLYYAIDQMCQVLFSAFQAMTSDHNKRLQHTPSRDASTAIPFARSFQQDTNEREWVFWTPENPSISSRVDTSISRSQPLLFNLSESSSSIFDSDDLQPKENALFVEKTPPFDLKGWDSRKLHSLKPKVIEDECNIRGLGPVRNSGANVDKLLKWKAKQKSGQKKRGRIEGDVSDIPFDLNGWDFDQLMSMRRDNLVQLCEERGVPKSGTKENIVDRLYHWKRTKA